MASDRARRSAWLIPGKPQYIMNIPEINHHANKKQKTTPIQRWHMMAIFLTLISTERMRKIPRKLTASRHPSLADYLTRWGSSFRLARVGLWVAGIRSERTMRINGSHRYGGYRTVKPWILDRLRALNHTRLHLNPTRSPSAGMASRVSAPYRINYLTD